MAGPDDERATAHPRPRQVTMGTVVAGGCSALVLVFVGSVLARIQSVDFREGVADFLERERDAGLSLSVDQALTVARVGLLVTGGLAAAMAVAAVFAARRDKGARIAMSALAVPLFLCGIFVSPFLVGFVVAATVLLWTRPASDWFGGRAPRPATVASTTTPPPPPTPTHPGSLSSSPTSEELRRLPPPGSAPTTYAAQVAPGHTSAPTGSVARGARPGRLIAASVVAALVSLLVLAVMAGVAVVVNTGQGREEIARLLRENPGANPQGLSVDQLVQGVTVMAVVCVVWALAAAVLAVLAAVGQGWARVALVTSAAVTAVAGLLATLAFPGMLLLTAVAVVVVVLLLHPDVNAWYAGRPRPERPRSSR